MLRTVADANVPFAEAAFGGLGPVTALPGHAITRAALRGADVLVVRSVTRVDGALLDGTPVRFVGSATAGVDHVDVDGLRQRGVAFASAPGSNAASVADYVLAALLAVAADRGEALAGRTLGVVGIGEVGGRLVPRARALGLDVVACDPPRAAAGDDVDRHDLAETLHLSDVVTVHTPLTRPGESRWPTLGLIGAAALAEMRPGAWLVNTARGDVLDGPAVLDARRSGRLGALVLDVWPGEPTPDPALVVAADLATPHVAGYAADAKVRGTAVIADALAAWAASQGEPVAAWEPPPAPEVVVGAPTGDLGSAAWLDALARQAVDVRADDGRFRAALDGAAGEARAAAFARLRRRYPTRHEMSRHSVRGVVPAALAGAVAGGLGMRV